MRAIEAARKLAQAGDRAAACKGYLLALKEESCADPMIELEAALYLLRFGSDYKMPYTIFLDLHNRGLFQEDILKVMTEAFYAPNVKLMRSRYEKNCKLLEKYPYFFRKDFLPFDQLPIRFYPYDDNSYVPYYLAEKRFGEYINFKDKRITRNFFHDLENPILAEDVYSEYELEYLNDNVRASEDIGRENHIYLHYTDWAVFCAYLTCLNLRQLLKSKKMVFLIEGESAMYPLDFKERFGIDYTQYKLKPVKIREFNKLIWHTQLSAHNGGDFFNEVFDAHPNMIALPSLMMSNLEQKMDNIWDVLAKIPNLESAFASFEGWPPAIVEELYNMRDRTEKDIFVAMYLMDSRSSVETDWAARIVPAIFFQPHFSAIYCSMDVTPSGHAVAVSTTYERIAKSPIFKNFKYIKTFTPIRRPTTSHGASVKFMNDMVDVYRDAAKRGEATTHVVTDAVSERILNRTFMIDPEDRLYHDSILVRFEDGKLNPKATFTALAAFLDVPYSERMNYCSEFGKYVPYLGEGYAPGFSPEAVYRTYDEYANDAERRYIEYFLRDVYAYCGYDFHYYDGQPVDECRIKEWVENFSTIDWYIRKTWKEVFAQIKVDEESLKEHPEAEEIVQEDALENFMAGFMPNRLRNAKILMGHVEFFNRNGQPLHMMPKLELDPALLEQPLYH